LNTALVLIHSPLVGALTWSRVGKELHRRGYAVCLPHLADSDEVPLPYWEQEAAFAARYISEVPLDAPLVLLAHSGAGPILPAIRGVVRHQVQAYLFVDAGIPRDRATRLDLMALESRERAQKFREHLGGGGTFPNWSEDDLQDILPDSQTRRALLAEVNPRGRQFFDEPIPAFAGWDNTPCGYIQFSAAYASQAALAREKGWRVTELAGGHFHMLVDPKGVTNAIVEMASALTNHEA
jgi:alpha/beta hydrolase family protein